MLQRSIGFGLALTCVATLALGCGDDDSAPDGGTDSDGSGMGASGSGPSTSGRSGSSGLPSGGSGPRPRQDSGMPMTMADAGFDTEFEGDPCGSTADCGGNLRCVSAGREFQFGVCARPCTTNADCGLEACLSLSGAKADLHCVNFERKEFGECGSLVTAACGEPRVCLGTSNTFPIGVCVNFCEIAGSELDAGAIPVQACRADQMCEDLDTEDPASPGFCVGHHARNDTCAPDLTDGKLCPIEDICAPIDPTVDDVTDFRCREDCTMSGTCAAGTCTDVQGEFAYCIE